MANTQSQLISEFYASPPLLSKVGESHGRQRIKVARFTTVAGEGVGHIYRLCRMRAHDRLLSIRDVRAADAGMTGCTIGIRTPVPLPGTADPAQIAAAQDTALVTTINRAAAAVVPVEILGTGGTTMDTLLGTPLWQMAGIATEPAQGTEYEVVMIVGGDPAGGGDTVMLLEYVAGD